MKRPLLRSLFSITAVTLILGGCAKLGPDFRGVENPPVPKKWKKHTAAKSPVVRWWRTFNDPVLNDLVQKAYAQNLDIKSAGLRIAQARAALGIAEGLAFPQSQKINAKASSTHRAWRCCHCRCEFRYGLGA